MSIVNYTELKTKIIGTSVPKPVSGTLSGHAAGEPFDKHVYSKLKEVFPTKTFRQYEYLNDLFRRNPRVISAKERFQLFNSPSVMFLLSRGKNATQKWDISNPFEEKQNDTADILVVDDGYYEIIDIKTRNISKSAQAPNIISSYKLAQLCATMIDNEEFDNLSINYFEIDWQLENDFLLKSISGHRKSNIKYINDFDFSQESYAYLNYLDDYEYVNDHYPSNVILLAKKKYNKQTWIDFPKFFKEN